jgi:hypothetical protein
LTLLECGQFYIRNNHEYKKTGDISGVPIVASDPVIYTVTATGRRGHDTATVVITVGVYLDQPATKHLVQCWYELCCYLRIRH